MANILIVDDEKSIRLTLKAFLEKDGHHVLLAEDAPTALALLQGNDLDVIVSDIVLPRVTGISLLQDARQLVPDIEVIIMTGEPTVETASEAVRAGAYDYLFKPISRDIICRTVNNAARVRALEIERKRLELANRAYSEELERLVAARTQELERAMRELRDQQVQLVQQERLRALGELASGIAHDFNNSLSVIMGFVELIRQKPRIVEDPARLARYLDLIFTAAKDGASVVNRLREFYRSRDVNEAFKDVDLVAVVREAVALTAPRWQAQAQARGIEVTILDQLQKVPKVLGDPAELREMFTNLIINAVDALDKSGTITLTSEVTNEKILVSVRDTGTGMSDEVKQRCLEPFFTTKAEHGTGLGLALTYGIAKRHGGAVSIESTSHVGTTVLLEFPVTHPAPHVVPPEAAVASPGIPRSILVVDDVAQIREMLAELLVSTGHTVSTASSGTEAMELFDPDNTDLVILDRAMPGMGGDELSLRIKELAFDMPIIMLTGFGSMMNSVEERPYGVDLVVAKPVQASELIQAINQLPILPR